MQVIPGRMGMRRSGLPEGEGELMSLVGVAIIGLLIIGLIFFIPHGVGPAVLGWFFLMWPGLCFLLFIDGLASKIIGVSCFLLGAIPTYMDIKAEREEFIDMLQSDDEFEDIGKEG